MLEELDKNFEVFRVELSPTNEFYVIAPTKFIKCLIESGMEEQEVLEALHDFEVPVVSRIGQYSEFDYKRLWEFDVFPIGLVYNGISENITFLLHNEPVSKVLERIPDRSKSISKRLLEQIEDYRKELRKC